MAYYCFLCNDRHDDLPTEEHFIPRSIDGPKHQWLPVCQSSNTRSNSVFDNDARDMLYWVRFKNTNALKRSGEALLSDGTLKPFKFSYYEDSEQINVSAFRYIFDRESNTKIPSENVYAIAVPVGLSPEEQKTYCRGLAKISIGALAYLLKNQGIDDSTIKKIFMQTSIDSIRHFAIDKLWTGKAVALRFSLGRSDVLERLQRSCENQRTRNHVIKIVIKENNFIHLEGMLYSQYGWMLDLSNKISIEEQELRLENSMLNMDAPVNLKDLSLSFDRICIINPDFIGQHPDIPLHWRNRENGNA